MQGHISSVLSALSWISFLVTHFFKIKNIGHTVNGYFEKKMVGYRVCQICGVGCRLHIDGAGGGGDL